MMKSDRETAGVLDPGMLINDLWQTTVETACPAEIGPRCGNFLRAWNSLAVERMETEGRLTPEDLATAEGNLRRFVQMMKTEAVFLGHANRLDRDCFQAAHRRLERRSILSQLHFGRFGRIASPRRLAVINLQFAFEMSVSRFCNSRKRALDCERLWQSEISAGMPIGLARSSL